MAYNYFCPNSEDRENCHTCNSKGDLQLSSNSHSVCPQNEKILLKLMGETVSGIIGPKMTKDQIRVDRLKRSSGDFVKNTLPTINPRSADGRHFHKKYKKK